ncbi:MAG: Fur family transcriptional regulator [Desulfovibrionaceae bacterium]
MHEAQTLFHDYLVTNKLKVTPQRKRILEVFLRSEGHFSAEDLYHRVRKKDPSVGQATVYRTLKILHDCGIAREVHFGDGVARYEHMIGHEHHDHLICDACGKNLEVVDPEIEVLQERLAKKHGFTLTGHRMYLYGLCPDCQK